MRALSLLVLLFGFTGCFQTENSNTLDADTYGNAEGTAEFLAARAIMTQNCAGTCHAYHTQSEADLKLQGLFVAGSPTTSKLYYRLTGSTGGPGPKDMPQTGPLQSSDVETIRTWIQNATP